MVELEGVYRAADAAFAGWTCPASTSCCRFGITGREPYVTSIELAAIQRATAALGGPVRRPEPRRRRLLTVASERPCPMLTEAGRCAIYAARPLGCRTYFCDRADPGNAVRHRQVIALVRAVQAIAAQHAPGGDQGRPLTRALAATTSAPRPSRRGCAGAAGSRS